MSPGVLRRAPTRRALRSAFVREANSIAVNGHDDRGQGPTSNATPRRDVTGNRHDHHNQHHGAARDPRQEPEGRLFFGHHQFTRNRSKVPVLSRGYGTVIVSGELGDDTPHGFTAASVKV